MGKGFKCQNCNYNISNEGNIGTKNRNHCPKCLYSKHVDEQAPGDRASECKALMKPIGLTLKKIAPDKYGNTRQGEIMIVHRCMDSNCEKISINRIAADDKSAVILNLFEESLKENNYNIENITFLVEEDREEIKKQLFGY